MTFLKRLRMLPVVLAVAAAIACAGNAMFGDNRPGSGPGTAADGSRPDGSRVVEDLAVSKFSKLPALSYQLRDGDLLFAWQLRPTVEAAALRPRDVLVLVDTSASQAGRPLQQARRIVAGLPSLLSPEDRVSIWTVNTPAATKPLTKTFFPANSDEVQLAAAALTEVEYGSGATDLRNGLEKAVSTLVQDPSRHQVVLFLGDGESSFNPISEDDRFSVGSSLDARDLFFFAVPLGVKVNPQNLHGLASLTGGAVVRLQEDLDNATKRAEFLGRLKASLDVPVVKVEKAKFGDEVGEVYPSRLPPLRADRSTLVMGKVAKADAASLSLAVKGSVANRVVNLKFNQPIPAPQGDHFFLNLMINQWRSAPHKEAPAMLQSDRALALASTQVKLYRDEFITQAIWAVQMDRWEDAAKLYNAALRIDPGDKEAAAGLLMIEKLKTGAVTKNDIKKKLGEDATGVQVGKDGVAQRVVQNIKAEAQPEPPAPGAGPGAPVLPRAADDGIRQTEAKRNIEEQRFRILTETTIRRARQLLRTDPDTAYQDLKRQREEILGYDGIGNASRAQMASELEGVMREIATKGAEIKRQAEAERDAIARTRQRLNEFDRQQDEESRLKNRISQFHQLMQQARFDLAYQESQLMIQERIAKGQSVPITATASYIIGQQATQLREWKELVRLREDRFLLSLMQTERAHIPYPDEPPVHFPPASVWRELTSLRREQYLNSNLGQQPSATQLEMRDKLENQIVELAKDQNVNEMTLMDLLKFLSNKYGVTFIVMEEYFKADNMVTDVREKKPSLASPNPQGLKLGTFLDLVLTSLNATFIVRPDYVEITTYKRRLEEKVTRVFPVADLVIPIPSTVNQQVLNQNLNVQNQNNAIFGAVLGAGTMLGGVGGVGGVGGIGGIGGIGGMGGMAGGGGGFAGNFAGGGQQQGNPFGNFQNNNQGFGGGFQGFGGGQLGQFGNLGGQFGLQGGDQSRLLMNLIVDTVARGEWANQPKPPTQPGQAEDDAVFLDRKQLNTLGYYPPARALVIRGTSRYHPATSVKLEGVGMGGQAAAPGNQRNGPVVIGPGAPADPANKPGGDTAVAANEGSVKPDMIDPNIDLTALKKKLSNDPKRMWNEAIDWTITDPGVIVATAEFLMHMKEYPAAIEVLKGGLRKGLATDDWVHKSLAIALQMGHGTPADVERAVLSGIDLDPTDPKAYIEAAKFEAEQKNYDQALAFCKRAAACDPDQPLAYANALAYAESATDLKTDAVVWAADNLLKRDWNAQDINYHQQVNERLKRLIAKTEAAGKKSDPIRRALAEQTQRDLVIELLWQGQADLDLVVAEPSGSVCSATQKRTTGGGVLKADILDPRDGNNHSEVYTAAMAFSGTYKVSVKKVIGQPLGDSARIKVTRYKGTPKESFDLIAVDLKDNKSVEVAMENGSRTELATVPDENDFRNATTGAPLSSGMSGLGGGFGTAGSVSGSSVTASNPQGLLPVVSTASETRLRGIGSSAADLRASMKINPDRQTATFHINPVFGTGKEVAMPKVPLLPGGEDR